MPRGRPKGSKSKGKVGRPRKNSETSSKSTIRKIRKEAESSPPRERKSVLVKQAKLTAAQVGPLIAKVSGVCDSVLSGEKNSGGSRFKSAIRVFTNELRRQMLSIGDEYMGSTASERKFLQLCRDRASLQKSLLNASKQVNDTRWDLRRTNQQQKAMVDSQTDLQELQSILRDLAGLKVNALSCDAQQLHMYFHIDLVSLVSRMRLHEATLLFKMRKPIQSRSSSFNTSICFLISQQSHLFHTVTKD
jgi:hypothetical protein